MRHGATLWNSTGRFQGSSDIALSQVGVAQAAAISRRLAREPIDRIYSSDRSRALETARAIGCRRGMEAQIDVRLREFDFGEWEGLTWDEIVRRHPELRRGNATAAREYAPPAGETFPAVRARVRQFLDEISARDASEGDSLRHVVAVTHAGPLHAVLAELRLMPHSVSNVRFSPGGITEITIDRGGATLRAFDDVRHLEAPSTAAQSASAQDDNDYSPCASE